MSLNHACHICDGPYRWRIERQGDAVVAWACPAHLQQVCDELQRNWERTHLVVWEPNRMVMERA